MKIKSHQKLLLFYSIIFVLLVTNTVHSQCSLEGMRKASHQSMVKEGGWKYAGYWDFKAQRNETTSETIPIQSDVILRVAVTSCSNSKPMFAIRRYRNYNPIHKSTDKETTYKTSGKSHMLMSKPLHFKKDTKIFIDYGASNGSKNWVGDEFNVLIFYKKI